MTSVTEQQKETSAKAGLFKKGQAAIRQNIKPMLATLVDKPFDDANWLYEVKWDGYRAVAYIENGQVEIQSRNNKSFTAKYYPITEMLSKWKVNAVLDGEIVVLNERGKSNFGNLQNWRSEADGHLTYYVFDILWYEGKNLMDLPFIKRREKNRNEKMYIDFLQNRPGATVAGPYSLRPKPGATVSMPLTWDEVKPGLTMKHFTIFNSVDRLKETGDLFKGVLGKGIDLEKTLKKAKSIFG